MGQEGSSAAGPALLFCSTNEAVQCSALMATRQRRCSLPDINWQAVLVASRRKAEEQAIEDCQALLNNRAVRGSGTEFLALERKKRMAVALNNAGMEG